MASRVADLAAENELLRAQLEAIREEVDDLLDDLDEEDEEEEADDALEDQ